MMDLAGAIVIIGLAGISTACLLLVEGNGAALFWGVLATIALFNWHWSYKDKNNHD